MLTSLWIDGMLISIQVILLCYIVFTTRHCQFFHICFQKKYKNTKLPLLKGLLWGTMLNASLTYLIPTATPWDKHCLLIFQDRETETYKLEVISSRSVSVLFLLVLLVLLETTTSKDRKWNLNSSLSYSWIQVLNYSILLPFIHFY